MCQNCTKVDKKCDFPQQKVDVHPLKVIFDSVVFVKKNKSRLNSPRLGIILGEMSLKKKNNHFWPRRNVEGTRQDGVANETPISLFMAGGFNPCEKY